MPDFQHFTALLGNFCGFGHLSAVGWVGFGLGVVVAWV